MTVFFPFRELPLNSNTTSTVPSLASGVKDKESGEPLLIDEKPVTSELVFTPEEAEGTVELSFTFDASALKGKTIVAFESVSCRRLLYQSPGNKWFAVRIRYQHEP